ncbi:hypothetical protein B0H63DRAFT_531348 [Podospora didyma]|uniref:T6SS Phospholipase effector Tle1-like catalytic domain-containing protein n=1 Tax=Podospora didyma TaxID=330526 RepID=A0AAE0P573_9PEZI|nr:hypothetical protein B0H63DRAFT_531348 [Podospora didyma]
MGESPRSSPAGAPAWQHMDIRREAIRNDLLRRTFVIVRNNGDYFRPGAEVPRPSKRPANLIFCIDGTGNNQLWPEHYGNPAQNWRTNVAKISHSFKPESHDGQRVQMVYYQPGLGTTSEKDIENFMDQAVGGGVARYVCSIYHCICTAWKPGDQIYLFGFSRGSYVARIIAALLADCGVFHWRSYRAGPDGQHKPPEELDSIAVDICRSWFMRKGGPVLADRSYAGYMKTADIQILSVFDTVSSLGVPDIGDVSLSCKDYVFTEQIAGRPAIKRAFHAISLSEHRENFKPVLFDKGTPQPILQCWFPGYHCCVGGGTADPGNTLPNVPLIWMVSKIRAFLHIDEDALMRQIKLPGGVQPRDAIPDSKVGIWKRTGDHYRVELGSGANETKHRTVRLANFQRYTEVKECPPIAPAIDAGKLEFDRPSAWELEKLAEVARYLSVGDGVHNIVAMIKGNKSPCQEHPRLMKIMQDILSEGEEEVNMLNMALNRAKTGARKTAGEVKGKGKQKEESEYMSKTACGATENKAQSGGAKPVLGSVSEATEALKKKAVATVNLAAANAKQNGKVMINSARTETAAALTKAAAMVEVKGIPIKESLKKERSKNDRNETEKMTENVESEKRKIMRKKEAGTSLSVPLNPHESQQVSVDVGGSKGRK